MEPRGALPINNLKPFERTDVAWGFFYGLRVEAIVIAAEKSLAG